MVFQVCLARPWSRDYRCTEGTVARCEIEKKFHLYALVVFVFDHFENVSSAALKAYLKYNNSLPSRIIVYRDGVGDGMLQSVVDYEVPQIMQSIRTMGADYE